MHERSSCQLSVVIVIHSDSKNFQMALQYLRAQTISARLELIIVAPSSDTVHLYPEHCEAFYDYRLLALGEINDWGRAKALGVEASCASLVAFMEDHSCPDPGWAEALVKAHAAKDVAVVGPVVRNGNPSSAISWACFLIFYGYWMKTSAVQKTTHLPGNQSCYKRDCLMAYGERLPEMLQAESVLHWDLMSKGYEIHLEKEALVYHLNFSKMTPTVLEYYLASRVFAGNRSKGWDPSRKTLYTFGSPLVPAIRLKRVLNDVRRGALKPGLFWKSLVPMIVILCAGALGEMLSYALGAGKAGEGLMDFERTHHTHFTPDDLAQVNRLKVSNTF